MALLFCGWIAHVFDFGTTHRISTVVSHDPWARERSHLEKPTAELLQLIESMMTGNPVEVAETMEVVDDAVRARRPAEEQASERTDSSNVLLQITPVAFACNDEANTTPVTEPSGSFRVLMSVYTQSCE
jgi:hypothetical protein